MRDDRWEVGSERLFSAAAAKAAMPSLQHYQIGKEARREEGALDGWMRGVDVDT